MTTIDHKKTKSQRSPKQNHRDSREQEIAEINRTSKSSPGLITKSAEAKITKIPSREHGGENKTVTTRSLRQRKSRRIGVESSRSEKDSGFKDDLRIGYAVEISHGGQQTERARCLKVPGQQSNSEKHPGN